MAPPTHPFSLDAGRIRLGDVVFVYLERTFLPTAPLPPGNVPRAYGVAPLSVLEHGEAIAGIWPGEGIWLGFQPVDRSTPAVVGVRVEGEPEHRLVCPPDHALPGRRSGAGYVPFSDGRLTILTGDEDPAQVTIRLVPARDFADMTGMPVEPIDPSHAYQGHRLP
jgi:hypothetical protein